MIPRRIARIMVVLLAGIIGYLAQGGPRAVAQDPGAPGDENGVEVLTAGPVHEAFAEPMSYNPSPGAVIPNEAPAAIEETPPDEKPAGDALWIPGYWQWDADRSDFIWISGIWRVPPPGCSWVPGYWTAVSDGWTWTSGFWVASNADEVTYLPQPPKSLEVGPSSPAPAADYIWAPGCWSWRTERYAWRPGYWVQARPDWVWSPSYYVDTPRGSVYIDGYWDYTIDRRGVLFAPAYIPRSLWGRPDYAYSPSIVIQSDALTAHLFISPKYGHYYFGDYYGTDYSRKGIYPWFEFHKNHRGYDPIYAQERWSQSRTNSHWEEQVRENYDYRVKHAEARPPRLYSAQAAFAARAPERERGNARIAAPLSEVAQRPGAPIRYEKIQADQRKSLGGQGKELAKYRDQRAQWEAPGKPTRQTTPAQAAPRNLKPVQASRGQLSRKPVEGQTVQSSQERVQRPATRMTQESVQTQPNRASTRKSEVQTAQPLAREKASQTSRVTEPRTQKIPKSPYAGRPAEVSGQNGNPPSRPDVTRSDSNPRARTANTDNAKHEAPASRATAPSNGNGQDKNGNRGGKNRDQ